MRSLWAIAALLALAAAAYGRAVGGFFAVDDFVFVQRTGALTVPGLTEIFAHRFLSADFSFWLGRQAFGLDPRLYHLVPLVLHVVNAWLVCRLLRRLDPDRPRWAAVAAVVFLLHPAVYTVMAWLAVGFNEVPTLTLCLVALELALSYVERPRLWLPLAACLCVVVAAGFKSQAILTPVYVLFLGMYLGLRGRFDRAPSGWPRRLAIVLAPCVAFAALFVVVVLPEVRQLSGPAYEQVWSLSSLAGSYMRLLPNSLNPLPVLREALGYQQALPADLTGWIAGRETVFRMLFTIAVPGVILYAAIGVGRLWLAVTLLAVLVGLLIVPASLAHHLYAYYAYFSLPAAAGLLAMPIASILERAWPRGRAGDGPHAPRSAARDRLSGGVAAIALLVWVWMQGGWLHASNGLVAQASHAERIDRFVRQRPAPVQLYFLPPTTRAVFDTVDGRSVTALHGARGMTAAFAGAAGAVERFASTRDVQLVAFDDLGTGAWQPYAVERAAWTALPDTIPLESGMEIAQPFGIAPRESPIGLVAFHLRGSMFGRNCTVVYVVEELHPASGVVTPTAEAVHEVVRGELACEAITHGSYFSLTLPRPVPVSTAGGLFRLRLRLADDGNGRVLLAAGVAHAPDILPVRTRQGADWVIMPDMALLHRVVTAP